MRLSKFFSTLIAALTLLVGMSIAQAKYEQPAFSATFPNSDVKFSQNKGTTTKDNIPFVYNQWADSANSDTLFFGVSYADYQGSVVTNIDGAIDGQLGVCEDGTITQERRNVYIGNYAGRGVSATCVMSGTKSKVYIYTKAAFQGQRLWQTLLLSAVPITYTEASVYLDSVTIN